jgi:hypothetical protein
MVRAFEVENKLVDETWAVRSTCNTALQSTPGQLVFRRDMIWDKAHVSDWQCVKPRKQTLINKNK